MYMSILLVFIRTFGSYTMPCDNLSFGRKKESFFFNILKYVLFKTINYLQFCQEIHRFFVTIFGGRMRSKTNVFIVVCNHLGSKDRLLDLDFDAYWSSIQVEFGNDNPALVEFPEVNIRIGNSHWSKSLLYLTIIP